MEIKIIEKNVPSSDNIHLLKGKLYLPEGEIKGYFHVVHGKTEHVERYHDFMLEIAKEGYLVFGFDCLGHGKTALADGVFGYFANKNGYKFLVNDVAKFYQAVAKEYGDHPYYLMGHSMGSFIVKLAATTTVNPSKLILMGTGGASALSGAGLLITALLRRFKGDKYISERLDKVAFSSYNKRFANENHRRSWLTSLPDVREKYALDPLRNFRFTVSAMHDLITLSVKANKKAWYKAIDKNLPVYLISGGDDPVGDYGNGVIKIFNKLKKRGANAGVKIYSGARHEILNDFSRQEVISDILNFIK